MYLKSGVDQEIHQASSALCRLRFCGHVTSCDLFLHERSALCGWVSLIPLSFYLEQHCPNHMIFHFLSIRWKGFSLAVGENRRNVQFLKEWKYVCTWNAWHNTRLFKKILMRSFSKYIRARVNFTADRYVSRDQNRMDTWWWVVLTNAYNVNFTFVFSNIIKKIF